MILRTLCRTSRSRINRFMKTCFRTLHIKYRRKRRRNCSLRSETRIKRGRTAAKTTTERSPLRDPQPARVRAHWFNFTRQGQWRKRSLALTAPLPAKWGKEWIGPSKQANNRTDTKTLAQVICSWPTEQLTILMWAWTAMCWKYNNNWGTEIPRQTTRTPG